MHGMFDGPKLATFAAAMGAICGANPRLKAAEIKAALETLPTGLRVILGLPRL